MATAGLLGTVLLALGVLCLGSGCSTLGYYGQAVNGHLDLLHSARPVQDWTRNRRRRPPCVSGCC